MIDHGNGFQASYAHCAEGSIRVQAGQQVDASTQICNVGTTGVTSWPHMHFVIKYNGVHQRIDQFFPRQAMHYCHFTQCRATNAPNAPVNGVVTAGTSQAVRQQTLLDKLPGFIEIVGPATIPAVAVGLFLVLSVIFWLGGLYVRVFVISFSTCTVVVGVALWFVLSTTTTTAMAPATVQSKGTAWQVAYSFMRQSEGARCVHDPGRTLKGITQGTYDRYRRDMGLGPADVCTSLTEQQAEDIYHRYYWIDSGAAQIAAYSPQTAITYFDMAVNAGNGVARDIYTQCGNNARCFNNARESFYRSAKGCLSYCAGWLARLNRIRQVTEG